MMRSFLNKMILIVAEGLTKEFCISAYLFTKLVIRLYRKSGALFTAFYLKQCSSSLQQAYGGVKTPHTLLPVPVSLTRSGYPQILPSFHRLMIYKKDDKADMIVRIYLSFFTIANAILIPKKVSKSTIIEPVNCMDSVEEFCSSLKMSLNRLLPRYVPNLTEIPLFQGMTWEPTIKCLPSFYLTKFDRGGLGREKVKD